MIAKQKKEARVSPGHDDNHSALIDLVNEGVLYYIAGNTVPNAFDVLNNLGVNFYLAGGLVAEEALNPFLNNDLEPLTNATIKRSIREK